MVTAAYGVAILGFSIAAVGSFHAGDHAGGWFWFAMLLLCVFSAQFPALK